MVELLHSLVPHNTNLANPSSQVSAPLRSILVGTQAQPFALQGRKEQELGLSARVTVVDSEL